MLVFGTRPEAIKLAPLILKLKSDVRNFDIQVCVTAQHRHMLDQVLELFKIEPDIDMNIMTATQDLFYITTNVLEGMKKSNCGFVWPHNSVFHQKLTRTESPRALMFWFTSELHISIVATSYRHKFTRFCDIQPDGVCTLSYPET